MGGTRLENVDNTKGLQDGTDNIIPEHPMYVIYLARNNTAMILQYVSNIMDNYNLEVIATDIPIERVEYYMRHIIHFTEFTLEGYKKAEGEHINAVDIKGISDGPHDIVGDKIHYTTKNAKETDDDVSE